MRIGAPRHARTSRRWGLRSAAVWLLLSAAGWPQAHATASLDPALGKALFDRKWVAAPASTDTADGLGPLFNARSCAACHQGGGGTRFPATANGKAPDGIVVRLSGMEGQPHPVLGRQLQPLAVAGFAPEGRIFWDGSRVSFTLADPSLTAHAEVRSAPSLKTMRAIERVDEAAIVQAADPDDVNGDGISGRARMVDDGKGGQVAGRFGLKAAHATLDTQIADAFAFDMGLSSRFFPLPSGDCSEAEQQCRRGRSGASSATEGHEISTEMVALVADYLRTLKPARAPTAMPALFTTTGCAACHTPALPGSKGETVTLFSDLLLHDLGQENEGVVREADVSAAEWRTAPLVDLFADEGRRRYMHDGRAATLEEAIARHGGEAEKAAAAFRRLNRNDKDALLRFLSSL
ncbi:MAG: hypothetical protein JNM45_12420 [Rhizobiales bacterium]|nr:hypothetical protein [Hyphomicrobiales bacterium]